MNDILLTADAVARHCEQLQADIAALGAGAFPNPEDERIALEATVSAFVQLGLIAPADIGLWLRRVTRAYQAAPNRTPDLKGTP